MFGLNGIVSAFRDLVTSIRDLTNTFRMVNEGLRSGVLDAPPASLPLAPLPAALADRVEAAPPAVVEAAINGEAVPEEAATPRRRRSS